MTAEQAGQRRPIYSFDEHLLRACLVSTVTTGTTDRPRFHGAHILNGGKWRRVRARHKSANTHIHKVGTALVNWGLHLLVDFKWRDWQRLLWGRGFRTEVWASDPFSRPRVEPGSPTLQADSLSSEPSGKPKNTGVGCHALLQGIFPAQGWNPRLLPLLHPQGGSLSLAPPGKRLYHSD